MVKEYSKSAASETVAGAETRKSAKHVITQLQEIMVGMDRPEGDEDTVTRRIREKAFPDGYTLTIHTVYKGTDAGGERDEEIVVRAHHHHAVLASFTFSPNSTDGLVDGKIIFSQAKVGERIRPNLHYRDVVNQRTGPGNVPINGPVFAEDVMEWIQDNIASAEYKKFPPITFIQ